MTWAIDLILQKLRTSAEKRKKWQINKIIFELIVLHDMGDWLVLWELAEWCKRGEPSPAAAKL